MKELILYKAPWDLNNIFLAVIGCRVVYKDNTGLMSSFSTPHPSYLNKKAYISLKLMEVK